MESSVDKVIKILQRMKKGHTLQIRCLWEQEGPWIDYKFPINKVEFDFSTYEYKTVSPISANSKVAKIGRIERAGFKTKYKGRHLHAEKESSNGIKVSHTGSVGFVHEQIFGY